MTEFVLAGKSRAFYDSTKGAEKKEGKPCLISRIAADGRIHAEFSTPLTEEQVRRYEEGTLDGEGVIFAHLSRKYPLEWKHLEVWQNKRATGKPLLFSDRGIPYEIFIE